MKSYININHINTSTVLNFNEYLFRCKIGFVLAPCLQELLEVRPRDPIFFIAQWLYKHADNRNYLDEKALCITNLRNAAQEVSNERKKEERRKSFLKLDVKTKIMRLPAEYRLKYGLLYADLLSSDQSQSTDKSWKKGDGRLTLNFKGLMGDFSRFERRRTQFSHDVGELKLYKSRAEKHSKHLLSSTSSGTSILSTSSSISPGKEHSHLRHKFIDSNGECLRCRRVGSKEGIIDEEGNFYEIKIVDGRQGYFDSDGVFREVQLPTCRDDSSYVGQYQDDQGKYFDRHCCDGHDGFTDKSGRFFDRVTDRDREGYMDRRGTFHQLQSRSGRPSRDGHSDKSGRRSVFKKQGVDLYESSDYDGSEEGDGYVIYGSNVKLTQSGMSDLMKKNRNPLRGDARPSKATCAWFMHGFPATIACYHPLLGVLKAPSRSRLLIDSANISKAETEYDCHTLNDQEIYTVCD